MADDREKNNQLVKAKRASLQRKTSNIIRRGLSDLALLDVEEAKITDEEKLLQAREWFDKGCEYDNNEDYDYAIEAYTAYTKAIELDPNYTEAYRKRGRLYYTYFDKYDEAIEDYTKAIALDPNYTADYKNRGLAYNSKGQHDRAIEDYNKAIALDPNDAPAYVDRGVAYDAKGQHDRAIEDYNKAIALDPNNALDYVIRGNAYDDKGQYDMAIEDYNKAIALDPYEALAYCDRGRAYEKLGNKSMAISDFQKTCYLGYEAGCWEDLQRVLGSGPYAEAKAKLLTTKNAGMEATLNSDYETVYEAIIAVAAESNINILEKEIDRDLKIGEIYGETSTGRESIKVLMQADGRGIGAKVLILTAAEMPLSWSGQPSTTQFLLDKIAKRLDERRKGDRFI